MENNFIKCSFTESNPDTLDAAEGIVDFSVVVERKSNFNRFTDEISKKLDLDEVRYSFDGKSVRLVFKIDFEEDTDPILNTINEVYESLYKCDLP